MQTQSNEKKGTPTRNRHQFRIALLAVITLLATLATTPARGDTITESIWTTPIGHTGGVQSVAFSPDGTQVLIGSRENGAARLWDADTGAELRTFSGHTSGLTSVAFSPDGTQVLTGSYDETARLWDADTGTEIRTFSGHTSDVFSVAFSPDGTQVLTGSRDTTAKLWDVGTGTEIRTFSGHTSGLTSVAFSPDGTQVLTGSQDDMAKLWDVDTGTEIRTFSGHTDSVLSASFSPDGTQVLTGSQDNTARLWDVDSGTEIRTFSGHAGGVFSVAFSPDGTQILTGSGSQDNTARLWDVDTGTEIRTFSGYRQAGNSVNSVAFSPGGTQVLTGSQDNTVRLWDVDTGTEIRIFSGHGDAVESVALSPDGTQVLTGSQDDTAKLWDADTGTEIRTFSGHTQDVESVAFSPDGTQVLTGSKDNTARLWDVDTGAEIRTFTNFPPERNSVYSVAFSPDGTQVLTGSRDTTAKLWDADTGTEIRTFSGHADYVYSVAFSPDGTQVLTGSRDETAKLWDADTGTEIRTFSGHTALFSPDGTQVLTGSYDDTALNGSYDTAKLWDADTGTEIRTFSGHADFVFSVAFSPDGTHVLTGSSDYTAKLWPVSVQVCFDLCVGDTTDMDGDGLPDCVEICNATDPQSSDTDGDGMPDGWETEHGTDPRFSDSGGNPDQDGLTNGQEFLAGTDPQDASDPRTDVYVARTGSDAAGDGSLENPWRTISFAMDDVARYSDLQPATINAAPGEYAERVNFVENVTVRGAGPAVTAIRFFDDSDPTAAVINAAANTALIDCIVTLPIGVTGAPVLILIDDEVMNIENVLIDGTVGTTTATGVFVTGAGSSDSTIWLSAFVNLERGVHSVDSNVNVTQNLFDTIRQDAVLVGFTTKQGEGTTPLLGDAGDIANTGFNRFRNVGDNFIKYDNVNPALTFAQFNDWGVYTEGEIRAKLSVPTKGAEDQIIVTPFIGKSLVPGSIAVELLGADSGDAIPETANPLVQLSGSGTERDSASSLWLFEDLAPGTYDLLGSSDGYVDGMDMATLLGAEIVPVSVELQLDGSEGEGEGEGGPPGCAAGAGTPRKVLLGNVFLLVFLAVGLLLRPLGTRKE